MILLVTPNERASECAAAVHAATDDEVIVADSLARATALLRQQDCLAVVLDQYLLEAEPHEAESMFGHLGPATPVQVNLAISGIDRVVREVRAALQRRQHEEESARHAAMAGLQNELSSTVTALLLSSEMALETPLLPPSATEKLRSLHDLVKKLRDQLELTSSKEQAASAART